MNNEEYDKKLKDAFALGFSTVEEYEEYKIEEAEKIKGIQIPKQVAKADPKLVVAPVVSEAVSLVANVPAPGHIGIKNCGNSCFINSILQMLYNIHEFRTGILALPEEERISEPFLTLYNIFSRIDQAKLDRKASINIDDLLNFLFECTTTQREANYAASYNDSKRKQNEKFRKLGIREGYFTEENLATYSNPSYSESGRKAFLDAKLQKNIAAIHANSNAEREVLSSALSSIKEAAEKSLEESIKSTYTGRDQEDAGEFLIRCIISGIGNTSPLYKLFAFNPILKSTGYFNDAELNEAKRAARLVITDEDNTPIYLYDDGLVATGSKAGQRKKFRLRTDPASFQMAVNLKETREDIQELFRNEVEDFGTGYRGLNIPREALLKLNRDRISDAHRREDRHIPNSIDREFLNHFPSDQRYFVTVLNRFINNGGVIRKNSTPYKINKQITVQNYKINDDQSLSKENITFELVGAVLHTGDFAGGHYRYIWKEPCTNKWVLFNDSIVSYYTVSPDPTYLKFIDEERKSPDLKINTSAYILLWKRKTGGPTPSLDSLRSLYLPAPLPRAAVAVGVAENPKETVVAVGVAEKPKETGSAVEEKSTEVPANVLFSEDKDVIFEQVKKMHPKSKSLTQENIKQRKILLKKLWDDGKDTRYLTRLVNEWDKNGKESGKAYFFKQPPPVQGYTRSRYEKNKNSMQKGGKRKTQRKPRKHPKH